MSSRYCTVTITNGSKTTAFPTWVGFKATLMALLVRDVSGTAVVVEWGEGGIKVQETTIKL